MANEKNLSENTENAIVAAENVKATVDFSNLENALQGLTANDYMNAERACRAAGDNTPELTCSSSFRARLAARALNMPYSEIKALGIKEYASITIKVGNFLFSNLVEV